MIRYLFATACAAAPVLLSATLAHAGGPYVVDDAATTPAAHCQIESWLSRGAHTSWVFAPACATRGPGSSELTLGLRGEAGVLLVSPAIKRTFRETVIGQPGLALSAALDFDSGGHVSALVLNAPMTVQTSSNTFVHLNVGWVKAREADSDRATWGINVEHRVSPRLAFIAETFGDSRGGLGWQAGLRHPVGARTELDLTIGRLDTEGPTVLTLGWAATF